MKRILDCFDYLKRYQIDIFESLCILLEGFLLKQHGAIPPLLQKAYKRQKIYDDYCQALRELGSLTPPNPHLNLSKVLKTIQETEFEKLPLFFDLITQKKTGNKLFYYTTPLEISILLGSLSELKEGETLYNPCFGLGSLFLQLPEGVKVYGEELDERFVKIATLVCRLGQNEATLVCNDMLRQPSFRDEKGFLYFDKIICNPPLHSHLGTNYIKEDERFSGLVSKNYPELVFFFHSLVHLKHCGVFILRKGVFKNLESKLKEALLGRLECIIELPKNIFPYQNHDFCIVIIKDKASEILYIDARGEHFCQKDGRYNRLKNLEEILELYRLRRSSRYSKLLRELDELFVLENIEDGGFELGSVASIFKGQRVYGGQKDEEIRFFEVGVSDFAKLGFSERFEHLRFEGQRAKIQKYALKPYDLLISWRGNSPKIAILSPDLSDLCVANMGVIVVRAREPRMALGLYVYFFSARGYERLCDLCVDSLDVDRLGHLSLPPHIESLSSHIQEIERLADELGALRKKIVNYKEQI